MCLQPYGRKDRRHPAQSYLCAKTALASLLPAAQNLKLRRTQAGATEKMSK